MCASLVGIATVLPAVTGCAPLKTIQGDAKQGMIEVPLSNFTETNNMVIIQTPALEYEIALIKNPDASFRAFELQCTHRANPLVATKSGFFCNLHGSRFALDGTVTQPPAANSLKEYTVGITNQTITIKL